ncbi:hypothetical protein HYC85_023807 [Camellia sinensis]|uniref:Alpha-1,3-mannosyl-glycoprotein 2-beta-N-acetylglucosaminyltransferase n=1 Tax=Camellia sinensis TaxID=4442 RepID=A0A7J7GJJ0_CAMSI|nr:hypothetical protein HYC85_023807 [Camellia sinensis]
MDQISIQKGRIVTLEEGNGLEKIIDKVQAPVAAVVVMACNRANYLERALKSILKYRSSVPSKYPLFVSQDGEDPDVKTKALSYNQLTYMQDKYVKHFADMVKNARPVCGTDDVLKECNIDCDVRIQYKDETDFEHIARQFGIFEEWKIRRKNQRSPRRLVKIATSSSNKGRWNGKWTSEYIFSLQQLHLQDLVEDDEDGDGNGNGNDNGNGGGRDTQVSITLSIEKHASFGLSVNGRIIITSLTRKCCNCSSPYSRKVCIFN